MTTKAFQRIYTQLEAITKATVVLKAQGVSNDELATVDGRLAQVVKIKGDLVTLQVFSGTEGIPTDSEVIFFGEGYGAKIQNGGLYRSDVSFILFDVMINGNYQPREMVECAAKQFNLEIVPIIFEGTLDEGIAYVKSKPMSTIGKAPMEGLVARPKVELKDRCGDRLIVKIKVRDFT